MAVEVVSIPIDGVIYGNEGDVIEFASGAVPEEHVGRACFGAAATDNNGSVHPNNDLIITTGATTVIIRDVEDVPGKGHTISGAVVLGETIEVSVKLGADGVSSGGFVLSFECEDVVPPATTAPPTTLAPTTSETPATTAPATTIEVTTSEAPEPSGPTTESLPPEVSAVPPTTAPPPAGPEATLPVTGTSTTYLVASSGFALLAAGVALLALVQLTGSRVRASRVRSE